MVRSRDTWPFITSQVYVKFYLRQFFDFEKFEQNYNHENFVVENLPYEEALSKKEDTSEHKSEQKILQALTQVK